MNTNYHELNTKAEGLASDSENEVAIIHIIIIYMRNSWAINDNYMLKEK